MARTVNLVSGEHYHIYNRGNSKQEIFRHPSDYKRFIATMYLANTSVHFNVRDALSGVKNVYEIKKPDKLVKVGAYCLMPNHFHFALSPLVEGGVSKFMLKLGTSYSMYFNTRYDRTGSLFEGRFKAKYADSDEYLKYLFSYIHLNPVAKMVTHNNEEHFTYQTDTLQKAVEYPYSSLQEYLSPRPGLGNVDTEVFDMYLGNRASIEQELLDWITYNPIP